jgi:hypothetical protein
MAEVGRPTGIRREDATEAALSGGTIDFEGREAQVVRLGIKSHIGMPAVDYVELDLGDERYELRGYFRDSEFIEVDREHLE